MLLDPKHHEFAEQYSFENPEEENVLLAIKMNMASRNMKICGAFATYHIAKTGLWHFGYFAHFFKRQRFLSIPIFISAIWYNTLQSYPKNLREAGIYDYHVKKVRFEKDCYKIQ